MTKGEFITLAVAVSAALARRFEGLFLTPYLCPAGYPTVGYGFTFYMDGRRVKLTDPPMTKTAAEVTLLWLVRTIYLPAVLKLCPDVDSPERLAALIDFAFNLGSGRLRASTLRRKVNEDDWPAAIVEMRKWIRGGGKVLRGLVIRCEARVQLMI